MVGRPKVAQGSVAPAFGPTPRRQPHTARRADLPNVRSHGQVRGQGVELAAHGVGRYPDAHEIYGARLCENAILKRSPQVFPKPDVPDRRLMAQRPNSLAEKYKPD
jgi:hypothetical protein